MATRSRSNDKNRCSVLAVAGLMLFASWGAACARDGYSFYVVPQFEPRKLYAIWKPIVDELERRTQVPLELNTTLTVQDFEREWSKGTFDFAYVNPFFVVRDLERQRYIPLIRDALPLHGILVVRKDSPIRDVSALNGKALAVPSPNALGASLMIRADLERLHHVVMVLRDVKTHSSVYLHVANGLADAGGGVEKTLQEQDPRVRDALRVLYTTRDIPSHPIIAHSRVPKAIQEKVRRAMLAMGADPKGQSLLAEVPIKQPIATSVDDYKPMQHWGLDTYWIHEEKGK